MDELIFEKMVLNSYPKLPIESKVALMEISHDILNIAIYGNRKFQSLQNWTILDLHSALHFEVSPYLIVRGAGQSRYNPMKWDGAHKLNDALTKLTEQYVAHSSRIKFGILLTDIWRPVELYEHVKSIEKFEQMGINSIAILFSGGSAIPVKWPWR
jgi:hypothetical protein